MESKLERSSGWPSTKMTEVTFTNGTEPRERCDHCGRKAHVRAICGQAKVPCCGQDTCKGKAASTARRQHQENVMAEYFSGQTGF